MSWKERGKFDYWIYEVYSFELDENVVWTGLIFGVMWTQESSQNFCHIHRSCTLYRSLIASWLLSGFLAFVPRSIPKHASLKGGLSPNVSTIKSHGQEWITGHKSLET